MQQEKYYECIVYKKLTTGFPLTLRNKCPVCRNIEFRNIYEKQRLNKLMKKELQAKHKKVQEKIKSTGTNYEDIDDDDISCSDDNKDEDFVPQASAKDTSSKWNLSISLSKTMVPKKKKIGDIESDDDNVLKRSKVLDMGI